MSKKSEGAANALVSVELIRAFTKLAQDPLVSTMVAWWWLQQESNLGWDDRQVLKVGIIDINRSRANIDSSIIFDFARESAGLAGKLGSAIALAAAAGASGGAGGVSGIAGTTAGMTIADALKSGEATFLPKTD